MRKEITTAKWNSWLAQVCRKDERYTQKYHIPQPSQPV